MTAQLPPEYHNALIFSLAGRLIIAYGKPEIDHGGLPLIFRQVINFCWFCIKWGLLLGAIGAAVVAFYFHDRVEEEIRCRVVEQIAKHYRGLKVTARSAALVEEGIEIRGLSILDPGAEGPRAELAYYDEICLSCSTDLQELMRGELNIKHITIRRPRLRAIHRSCAGAP